MPDTLSRPFPQSTATLIDRGNGMIYDPNQNITRQQKAYFWKQVLMKYWWSLLAPRSWKKSWRSVPVSAQQTPWGLQPP